MAIKINFDTANNPEMPTLILATRDGSKLGLLEAKQIELSEKLIGASEITFIVNKYVDGRLTNLWDKIVDFKLVYCKEWNVWFEIRVEIDEDSKTVKTVFGTQLGQAELSQLMLYNIEINTEADIARDDYKISVLYDPDDPEASILHRLFDKAPHYSFGHVDGTLYHIQRSFSFDETSIYDALQEIAEEVGCLFVFHSGMTDDGGIERYIEVWDLEQYCKNANCKYRGEFTEVCPKCGNTDIDYGYGEDTTIFITADELASNNIQFTTDTDSVKNCFKLEAGDDLMTATIRNCNPNGTDYIWYFSDSIKEDMSEDLKKKLTDYDALYLDYQKNHSFSLDASLLNNYNTIVNKYKSTDNNLKNITSPITGYSQLMNAYYNVVDLSLYLESSMMPTVATSGTTAAQEAAKLTPSNLSPLAVTKLEYASRETVNSIAVGMAKVFVKPTYKVEINGTPTLSDFVEGATTRTWKGSFTITNYSDEEDTTTTSTITLTINSDAELFTKQKIEKALNNADAEDYSVVGLFKKSVHTSEIDNCSCDFCKELRKYALKPLSSFRDACQACIDILVEQGYTEADLYDGLYLPYWRRLKAIEKEMKIREDEIAAVDGVYDTEGNLLKRGLASDIEKIKEDVQDALDFESYLGDDLLIEFSSYRREDKYKNENYISDGLNNAELFERALEFIETAENEIFKSAELQHSISSSLKNLMAIEKFKPLKDYFEVGNWMRIQIDDIVYKLRLLEYTIDFDNFEDIPVVFSDVSKVRNGITDLEDIFSQASSMTTHYEAVKRQASKGQAAQGTIEQWLDKGLNSALVRINSNNSEEVSITQGGILCRSYDASTDSYSNEQLKLTHNIMAYTNDDWKTVKQAIGKHDYVVYDKDEKSSTYDKWIPETGYGMSAEFVTSGYLIGSTIVGGEIYSANYSNGKGGSTYPVGTYINLQTGEFSFGGEKIVYDKDDDTITLNNVTIKWADDSGGGVNPPEASNISGLEAYLNQLDGMIGTYSQENDPSSGWTSEQKAAKVGDLWFNPKTGLTKRWNGSSWDTITDKDLQELAQSKAQIFTSQPTPPYYVGDLWVQGSSGEIMHCTSTRTSGDYDAKDWAKSSKYTDDTSLNTFINGDYKKGLADINSQLDKKAETWYQEKDPSTSWTDADKPHHVGDLWHCTAEIKDGDTVIRGKDSEWVWQNVSGTYKWCKMEVPDEVFDAIDGKSAIYASEPKSQEVGDLLIPEEAFSKDYGGTTYYFTEEKVYRCTLESDLFRPDGWSEISYMSNDAFQNFLDNEYKDDLDAIKNQLDQKAETWYQANDPSTVWNTTELQEKHVGDLWHSTKGTSSTDDDEDYVYTKINNNGVITYEWVKSSVEIPKEVYDLLDGKSAIYVKRPTTSQDVAKLEEGDLLIPADDTDPPYKAGKVYRWTGSLWSEIDYTNDDEVDKVKGGIKFTEIDDQYVISPHIVGGDLKIVDKNGNYSAEITSNGQLKAKGAEIQGDFKSGYKTGGYNFQATNGVVSLGVQDDGTYAMTVGSNGQITFGKGVTLSWDSITGKPNMSGGGDNSGSEVSEEWVTNIAKNAITTEFLNVKNITAKAVSTDWVYAGNVAASQITAGTLQSVNGNTYFDLNNNKFVSEGTNANWSLNEGIMKFTVPDGTNATPNGAVVLSTDAYGMMMLHRKAINGVAIHNGGSLAATERNGALYGVANSVTSGQETSVIKFFTSIANSTDYDTMIDRLRVRTQDVVCKTLQVGESYETQKNLGIYRGTAQVCYSSSGNNTTLYSSSASDNDHTYECYMKGSTTITFKKAFAQNTTPTVVVSLIGTGDPLNHNILVSSRSNTSFTVNYKTTTDGAHPHFQWIAIGTPA